MPGAVSRRKLLLGSLSLLSLATPAISQTNLLYGGDGDGFARDPSLLPPPESPVDFKIVPANLKNCLLYTSPSPRDRTRYRMPSSA